MGIRYSGLSVVAIYPIRIEVEREADGRILASVPDLPGVMAYGAVEEEAVLKAKSLALQVLADMIDSGEDAPASVATIFWTHYPEAGSIGQ